LTYEDLLIAIDHAAPKLSESSLRVLLRLVSLAIHTCCCEVKVSHRSLAEQLGMSQEGVARGVRGLSHLIETESRNTATSTFVLPAEWFAPSVRRRDHGGEGGSPPGGTHYKPDYPTNQGSTALRPRAVLTNEVGQCCPTNQGSLPYLPGQVPYELGHTAPPARAVATEHQQLSDASLIRSDQDLNQGTDSIVNQIRKVAFVENVREDQKEVAALLYSDLMRYMQQHHPQGSVDAYPSERIIARCLAIADYEHLAETLKTLHNEGQTAGKKFAWFVSIFFNRIYGIDAAVVARTFEQVRLEKKGQPQQNKLFADELIQHTAAQLRKMG
jgi:hypothetical protein